MKPAPNRSTNLTRTAVSARKSRKVSDVSSSTTDERPDETETTVTASEGDDAFPCEGKELLVNDNDVICGRGKLAFHHVGNVKFREMVGRNVEKYQTAEKRLGKPLVVQSIIDQVYAEAGRFLKRDTDNNKWVELTLQQQKDKVSHAIRDATKEIKRKGEEKARPARRAIQLRTPERMSTKSLPSMPSKTLEVDCKPSDLHTSLHSLEGRARNRLVQPSSTSIPIDMNYLDSLSPLPFRPTKEIDPHRGLPHMPSHPPTGHALAGNDSTSSLSMMEASVVVKPTDEPYNLSQFSCGSMELGSVVGQDLSLRNMVQQRSNQNFEMHGSSISNLEFSMTSLDLSAGALVEDVNEATLDHTFPSTHFFPQQQRYHPQFRAPHHGKDLRLSVSSAPPTTRVFDQRPHENLRSSDSSSSSSSSAVKV